MPNDVLPLLNYLWIGPPKSYFGRKNKILESDVRDVIEMAKKCDNHICYYCLDEYKNFYTTLFKKQKVDVTVVSVDEYLEEILSHEDQFTQDVNKIIEIKNELLYPTR